MVFEAETFGAVHQERGLQAGLVKDIQPVGHSDAGCPSSRKGKRGCRQVWSKIGMLMFNLQVGGTDWVRQE